MATTAQVGPAWGIRTIDAYLKQEQVGEGTYGHVFKGTEKATGERVALKRLIFHNTKESAGMPLYAVREITILKRLSHKNLVQLKDIVVSFDPEDNNSKEPDELQRCGQLYLVFEYVDHDLAGLLDHHYEFSPRAIKTIMKQLFEVLNFLHSKHCIHRDIKCSNLLLSSNYVLKLADFGLARCLNHGYDELTLRPGARAPPAKMTFNVITLWYRPPELLLGCRDYDYAVDMWSAGCILAELLLGRPLFPAKTETQQLDLIFQIIGTPSSKTWPEYFSLPNPYQYRSQQAHQSSLDRMFPDSIPESAVDLVQRLLVADPNMRYTAQKATDHRYFFEDPKPPSDPQELGSLNLSPGLSLHEYQTKKAKRAAKAAAQAGTDSQDAPPPIAPPPVFPEVPPAPLPYAWYPPHEREVAISSHIPLVHPPPQRGVMPPYPPAPPRPMRPLQPTYPPPGNHFPPAYPRPPNSPSGQYSFHYEVERMHMMYNGVSHGMLPPTHTNFMGAASLALAGGLPIDSGGYNTMAYDPSSIAFRESHLRFPEARDTGGRSRPNMRISHPQEMREVDTVRDARQESAMHVGGFDRRRPNHDDPRDHRSQDNWRPEQLAPRGANIRNDRYSSGSGHDYVDRTVRARDQYDDNRDNYPGRVRGRPPNRYQSRSRSRSRSRTRTHSRGPSRPSPRPLARQDSYDRARQRSPPRR